MFGRIEIFMIFPLRSSEFDFEFYNGWNLNTLKKK